MADDTLMMPSMLRVDSPPAGAAPAAGQPDLDLSSLDKQFDPQITAERERAEHYEQQSVKYSEEEANVNERLAGEEPAQMQAMDSWLKSVPTRQAAYATTMHMAPMFALLTAIGGKVTKLSGMNMLSATNGIVQGLNQASEKLYEDSYNAWMNEYNKLKEHQTSLMRQHQLMLEAYRGRADAYQKAGDAARRMTGDLLDQKQQAVNSRIHSFTAQSQAFDRITKAKYALEQLHERQRHDIAQESHWKDIDQRISSGKVPPAMAQQLKAEHENWQNAKAQIDEFIKQRGQINANLSMSDEVKTQMLQRIDDQVAALELAMDQSVARTRAIASQIPAAPLPHPGQSPAFPGGAQPSSAGPPQPPGGGASPAAGAAGAAPGAAAAPPGTDQSPQVSPGKRAALEQHKGQPVTFADNTTWIMDQNGAISRVH
jgi:hypothetical protein